LLSVRVRIDARYCEGEAQDRGLVQEGLFAGEHLPDYLETQIVVDQDLVYAGRDFPRRSGTAIVLRTNSDFGCVASARVWNQDEAEYALNVHLHEGHLRTSLLKSVAGDREAFHSLNAIEPTLTRAYSDGTILIRHYRHNLSLYPKS